MTKRWVTKSHIYVLPTMRLMEHSNITYISFPAYKLEPDDGQLTFCCDQ